MATDVLQQVLPPALSRSYQDGFTQLEGYVVRAADVLFAKGAFEVIEAFGYGGVAGAYAPDGAYVDVLRFPVMPLQRLDVALGGPDLVAAAQFGGDIIDHPPFTGRGFTASRLGIVAQWRLRRTRMPPRTELYRIFANGTQTLLAAYGDIASGWSSSDGTALPSHLIGLRARWRGEDYLADIVDDGAHVVLASIGDRAPEGFESIRPYLSRRLVARGEVDQLTEIITSCRWRDEPFEVTGTFGDQCRLTYTGRNAYDAESAGLEFIQPGVYEATASLSDLDDVHSVVRELDAT